MLCIALVTFAFSINSFSQKKEDSTLLKSSTFSGLKFRSIGPAFMSGRIADIAIHPEDDNTWYVAVGSGGVWKTTNSGTTWKPIFDSQKVYSIGCVTIDPINPHVVWVGTGENIGGRHCGYGDGVYRSDNGGSSWKNLGLKESQHISKILIHPENSDIIWVAAQGPLWNKGDERGLYKSVDGGKTWKKTLGDDAWVGVTDIVMDPRNPDLLYAATWQRHRNVAAYMGGGPGTKIYRSYDGGENWEKISKGLPGSNMGKIGLAISPQKPDVIYAAIELDRRTGAVYKSTNRGASWTKQSTTVSGATGPHYYQELYASPHQFDRIYLMDVRIQVSDDGGKTFRRLNERRRHGDNHALAFRKDDPDYLLVGTDGGVYESFDLAESWKFISNLPITQYYKVAVDDALPFYNIYGGTQDNGTQGGPSRTDSYQGISNEDWAIVYGGDGHQPATEPGNPDIYYAESQQGYLSRIDKTTGESVGIRPQPEKGEGFERFNWDSPILVSPHSPTRLYFASQRVWRSDDRGDSWTAISSDLTKNQERFTLPIMDQTWSWDSPWDIDAMSKYNTITSLAESPIEEGVIYAGTDDGIIQVTEDGGQNWRKIEVGSLPDVPETAFVNDIKADLFDANTVYIALDNHKFGDLNPYLYKSTDRGKSWSSMKSNIPEKTLVWRIVQDYEKPELFFLATEFGIYFTIDAGEKWIKLKSGVPTISFRDLAIQRRENDLVGASFGRSFYIFDDYSVLRQVSEEQLAEEATLFTPRDTWWYRQTYGKGSQGSDFYTAPNPPHGAVFTYYLKESYTTRKAKRQKEERKKIKDKKEVDFPGWDQIEAERRDEKPAVWLTIKDMNGAVVRRVKGKTSKGFHRITWDMHHTSSSAINIYSENKWEPRGMLAQPGTYTVSLSKEIDGVIKELAGPVEFKLVRMREGALPGATPSEAIAFGEEVNKLIRSMTAASQVMDNASKKVKGMQSALIRTPGASPELNQKIYQLNQDLYVLDEQLNGNRSKRSVGEGIAPKAENRLYNASSGTRSTYGPTKSQRRNLEIAKEEFVEMKSSLLEITEVRIPAIEQELIDAGAPWMDGMEIPE